MSSNYGNLADTVTVDFVKTQCPKIFEAFRSILNRFGVDLNSFFLARYFGDDYSSQVDDAVVDIDDQLIEEAYESLQKDFLAMTGLELGTVYHDAEEQSDELDGGSFSVDGVYQLSTAGKKHIKDITRLHRTTFG